MHPDVLQLAIETPACGLRVILVAGELDRASSCRLARLVDVQTCALADGAGGTGHIIIDLGNVRFFGVGGLEVLLTARDASCRAGVTVHLAGLGARELLLPQRVIGLLAAFSTFDTLERALRQLLPS